MARNIGPAASVIAYAVLFAFIGPVQAQSGGSQPGGEHVKAAKPTHLNSSKSNAARVAPKSGAAAKRGAVVKSKSNITNN